MTAVRYKKFLKLLEMWPIDESKVLGDRDLGKFLRKQVAMAFNKGETTTLEDEAACDQAYDSLYKIATDHHRQKHGKSRISTASKCSLEELKILNSSEGLMSAKDEKPGFFDRFARLTGQKKERE